MWDLNCADERNLRKQREIDDFPPVDPADAATGEINRTNSCKCQKNRKVNALKLSVHSQILLACYIVYDW